jgi:hypothetical protein
MSVKKILLLSVLLILPCYSYSQTSQKTEPSLVDKKISDCSSQFTADTWACARKCMTNSNFDPKVDPQQCYNECISNPCIDLARCLGIKSACDINGKQITGDTPKGF